MTRFRNNPLVTALVAAIVGLAALPVPVAPAAPEGPPLQIGVLAASARLVGERRAMRGRWIRRLGLRTWLPERLNWSRVRRLAPRARLPLRDSYARGPPRHLAHRPT